MMVKQTFFCLDDDVGFLRGKISRATSNKLKSWLKSLQYNQTPAILLLDTEGGFSDVELLMEIVKTPLHIHVLKNAQSWGMAMAMCASTLSCNPGSAFMLHKPRWDMHKNSEEIARDEHLMTKFTFETASILSSVSSCMLKDEICDAFTEDGDTYFHCDWLWEQGLIDHIGEIDLQFVKDRDAAKIIEELYNAE